MSNPTDLRSLRVSIIIILAPASPSIARTHSVSVMLRMQLTTFRAHSCGVQSLTDDYSVGAHGMCPQGCIPLCAAITHYALLYIPPVTAVPSATTTATHWWSAVAQVHTHQVAYPVYMLHALYIHTTTVHAIWPLYVHTVCMQCTRTVYAHMHCIRPYPQIPRYGVISATYPWDGQIRLPPDEATSGTLCLPSRITLDRDPLYPPSGKCPEYRGVLTSGINHPYPAPPPPTPPPTPLPPACPPACRASDVARDPKPPDQTEWPGIDDARHCAAPPG